MKKIDAFFLAKLTERVLTPFFPSTFERGSSFPSPPFTSEPSEVGFQTYIPFLPLFSFFCLIEQGRPFFFLSRQRGQSFFLFVEACLSPYAVRIMSPIFSPPSSPFECGLGLFCFPPRQSRSSLFFSETALDECLLRIPMFLSSLFPLV